MTTVLRGGRVITVAAQGVIERGVVVVQGGRITAVGAEGAVAVPAGATEVVDVRGRTILPGLIDMHTHVVMVTDQEHKEGPNPQTITASMLRAVNNARRATASGVTTLRDLGSQHTGIFALREAINRREMLGPRMLLCGAAICMTGGHGYNNYSVEADGVDAVRAAARAQLKLGAEWVKVMATGGAGTPGERVNDCQLTIEEMAAAVEEGRHRDRKTSAHAGCPRGVLNALKAGVNTIEHGLVLDDACIQGFLATGAYLIPTIEVYERLARGKGVFPAYAVAKAEQVVGPHKESYQKALKAGVKIVAGTDAGNIGWPLGDFALELVKMVEYGMSPMATIEAATSKAADLLDLSDQIGALEAGKLADVVVVDGNPLDDMMAMRNVWLVMKEGQVQVAPRA